jgi:hypothetical protein
MVVSAFSTPKQKRRVRKMSEENLIVENITVYHIDRILANTDLLLDFMKVYEFQNVKDAILNLRSYREGLVKEKKPEKKIESGGDTYQDRPLPVEKDSDGWIKSKYPKVCDEYYDIELAKADDDLWAIIKDIRASKDGFIDWEYHRYFIDPSSRWLQRRKISE